MPDYPVFNYYNIIYTHTMSIGILQMKKGLAQGYICCSMYKALYFQFL